MDGLFWDGGSLNLESQAFGPLSAVDEMNQALPVLIDELNAVPDYVNRFKRVFNTEITTAGIVRALAQFQRTLISSNSRYDKYSRKETGGYLSTAEERGLQLVRLKCASCHSGELFTDNGYHNNGIDSDFSNTEHENIFQGRYRITYNTADMGKFKTPTLRNSMLTAPYMHDGRFSTMEEVLNHYSDGVKITATTDVLVQQGNGTPGISLTADDKKNIIAFLHTLTDSAFIHNSKFSSPF
jgi:cytochrome c peroxidase